jgi:hypothetical protein
MIKIRPLLTVAMFTHGNWRRVRWDWIKNGVPFGASFQNLEGRRLSTQELCNSIEYMNSRGIKI